MFDFLARLTTRWPKTILLITLIFIGVSLGYGRNVVSSLQTGGSTDPGAQSTRAEQILASKFAAGQANLVLLVRSAGSADEPSVAGEGRALTARLAAEPGLEGVASYWSTGQAMLRSRDHHSGLIVGHLEGTDRQQADRLHAIAAAFDGPHGPVTVQIGGSTAVNDQSVSTIRHDISRAEEFGIPLTELVLILAFRSFVAALLPLLVGITAVIGTNAELKLLSSVTSVSVFSLNLATGLSLGLAADYGLFMVRRYREEYHRSNDVPESIRITLHTAGRTVLYSTITVVVAMLSMLIFPLYFLKSFGYAGTCVVVLAALSALVALPAGLVVLGKNVDALDLTRAFAWVARLLRGGRQRVPAVARGSGWRRLAEAVMRRPVWFAASTTALLVLLLLPFFHVQFGIQDDRLLPASFESHIVQQSLRDDFDAQITSQLDVVTQGFDPATRTAQISGYAAELSRLPGAVRVTAVTGTYVHGRLVQPPGPATARLATRDATYFTVASGADDISPQGKALVAAVRDAPAPFHVLVGGSSADLVDALNSLRAKLPFAMGIIALASLVLIFLLTGSVLIPFKALVMNLLSLTATFGALVWIFQDHHLAGMLHFQQTGWLSVELLVLLFCVAFGVSMDYEVFLLSRMKEEHRRTGDNRLAIAYGIEKTGGVVTAAALITSIVFISIGLTARITNIQMFGVGLALAMIMDASVVRTILVPALMRLAGRVNWWAPAPLRSVYDRFGLREDAIGPAAPAAPAGPGSDHIHELERVES
jgi:RND superfamily putative drug exporter